MLELPLPLHLAVHLVGLAATSGLAVDGWSRRRESMPVAVGLVVAGVVLATTHLLLGSLVTSGVGTLLLRAGAYAALAVAATGAAVLPVVLVAPVGARVLTAVVGTLAAAAARGGVLGRGRDVLPLTLGVAGWAVADLVAGSQPTVAAALSLAGSGAVGAWLLQRADASLASRITAGAVGVLLVVVLVLASGAGFVFGRDLTADRLGRLEDAVAAQVSRFEEDPVTELSGALELLSGSESLSRVLTSGTQGDAFAAQVQAVTQTPDLVLLVDVDGRVVGSFDRRQSGPLGVAETTLAGTNVVVTAQAQAGTVADLVAIELEGPGDDTVEILAMAAAPVYVDPDRQDVPAGVLMVARRLTTAEVVARVADDTGADAALVVGGRVAAGTGALATGSGSALATEAARTGSRVVTIDGEDRFFAARALRDVSATAIATLVLTEPGGVVADLEEVVVRTLYLAAVLGGLLAVGLVLVVTRRTTTPLRRLTGAAERVTAGDLEVDVGGGGRDEVGRLGQAFGDMTSALRAREADLQAAAREQRDLREQLESVTSAMGEALLAVDLDGRVVLANPAATTLLGDEVDALLGRPLTDVLHGRDELGLPLLDMLGRPDDPTATSVRGSLLREGRADVAVAATAAPLSADDGDVVGRVLVLRDIDAEAQVDRMKTEFLSNISHELRTPLTPVRAYAQLLAQRPDLPSEQVGEFAGSIVQATQRLERIIGMLVDFAALQAGRVEVNLEPLDVDDAVEAARARWRDRAPDRTIRRRLARDLPPVLADADLLVRVLDELLDNALKFSTGDVTLVATLEDDGRVSLGVRDQGVGMDDDTLASLGEDFHQADGSATRAHGGLGLGLSIVARIVEELNGRLEATSDPGRLTHVAVRLPVARSRAS